MPYNNIIFYNYGTAAGVSMPTYIDEPDLWWDPSVEVCEQEQFRDFTGADSLAAFVCSILVFVGIQWLEFELERPLFNFIGLVPYKKEMGHEPADVDKGGAVDKGVEVELTGNEHEESSSDSKGIAKETDSGDGDSTPGVEVDDGVPVEAADYEIYA